MARTKQTARKSTATTAKKLILPRKAEVFSPNQAFHKLSKHTERFSELLFERMLKQFQMHQSNLLTTIPPSHTTIFHLPLPGNIFTDVLVPLLVIKEAIAFGSLCRASARLICLPAFALSMLRRATIKLPQRPLPLLDVRTSSLHGSGTFATQDIAGGTPICIVTGEVQAFGKLAKFDDHSFLLPGEQKSSYSSSYQCTDISEHALSPFRRIAGQAPSTTDDRCAAHFANHACAPLSNSMVVPLCLGIRQSNKQTQQVRQKQFRNAVSSRQCPNGHLLRFSSDKNFFMDVEHDVDGSDQFEPSYEMPFGYCDEGETPKNEVYLIYDEWGEDSARAWLGYVYRVTGGVFLAEQPGSRIFEDRRYIGTFSTMRDAAIAVEQQARKEKITITCEDNGQNDIDRNRWNYMMTHPPDEIGMGNWTEIWENEGFPQILPRPLREDAEDDGNVQQIQNERYNNILLQAPTPVLASLDQRCSICNTLIPWSPVKSIGIIGWICDSGMYKLCLDCMEDSCDFQCRNAGGQVFDLGMTQTESSFVVETRDSVWTKLCRPLLEYERTYDQKTTDAFRSNYVLVLCAGAQGIKMGTEVTISYTAFKDWSVVNKTKSQPCEMMKYEDTLCSCQIYEGRPHTMSGRHISQTRELESSIASLPAPKRQKVTITSGTNYISGRVQTITVVDNTNALPTRSQGECPNHHLLIPLGKNHTGKKWTCSGSSHQNGCVRGFVGNTVTKDVLQYRCSDCDFDVCDSCLDRLLPAHEGGNSTSSSSSSSSSSSGYVPDIN